MQHLVLLAQQVLELGTGRLERLGSLFADPLLAVAAQQLGMTLRVLKDAVGLQPQVLSLLGGAGHDPRGLPLGLLELLAHLDLSSAAALAELGVHVAHERRHLGARGLQVLVGALGRANPLFECADFLGDRSQEAIDLLGAVPTALDRGERGSFDLLRCHRHTYLPPQQQGFDLSCARLLPRQVVGPPRVRAGPQLGISIRSAQVDGPMQ
jgi:hypothetical protein